MDAGRGVAARWKANGVSHPLRSRDADQGEPVSEHRPDPCGQREPWDAQPTFGVKHRGVGVPVVELPGQIAQVLGEDVRSALGRGLVKRFRVRSQTHEETSFGLFREALQFLNLEGVCSSFAQKPAHTGVGVLNVVNGIVRALTDGKVEVEVKRLRVRTQHVKEAGGIATDFLAKLTQRDEIAGARRHARPFSPTPEGDELNEYNLEPLGRLDPERVKSCVKAWCVAVMIGPKDVDETIVAAIGLLDVIGQIGCEVRVRPRRTDEDTVLLVTVRGGPEPERSLIFVNRLPPAQPVEEGLDHACRTKLTLRSPAIEADSKGRQILADLFPHGLESLVEHLPVVLFTEGRAGGRHPGVNLAIGVAFPSDLRKRAEKAPPVPTDKRTREIAHVVAPVRRLRKHDLNPQLFEIAQPNAQRQNVHLPTGVVEVVLTLHVMAHSDEKRGQAVTIGGSPSVPDVQRAVGIGRNELNENPLGMGHGRNRAAFGVGEKRPKLSGKKRWGEAKIEKPRSGDLCGDLPGRQLENGEDPLSEPPRRKSRGTRKTQRNRTRVLPVRGIGGSLEHGTAGIDRPEHPFEGGANPLFKTMFDEHEKGPGKVRQF